VGRIDGRTAIVTGAGGEIGRRICLRLAREGARVPAVDLDSGRVEETVAAVADQAGPPAPRSPT
jgi:NAD(P)-dependent dehydrogenase (short-subunit alcohol dehydrogenase family)